jgi:hypothetical protein
VPRTLTTTLLPCNDTCYAAAVSEQTGLSFRDFAAAIGDGDTTKASATLVALLAVEADAAATATAFFQRQMADSPNFLMKAMSMRYAVADGTPEQVEALMTEIFDLKGGAAKAAAASVIAQFKS